MTSVAHAVPSIYPASMLIFRVGTWPLAVLVCAGTGAYSSEVRADYKDDIGYRLLQTELGSAMPTGAGVPVMHVEATLLVNGIEAYMPNPADTQFVGKTISDESNGPDGVYSDHATAVGSYFYGNFDSTAPGIALIDSYNANGWVQDDFVKVFTGTIGSGVQPLASPARIANHSWIGQAGTYDSQILRRVDWVIARDEFIHAIGLNNGNPNRALLSTAFNVIAVGRTTGAHGVGSVAVDTIYTAGRIRPDVVTPGNSTSAATPQVAAAAALLVEVGQASAALSTDPVSLSVTSRAGTVIRNASRSEVIKAALMAGASRTTANTSTSDITDYRVAPGNQATNGLDIRFGAGQVNVRNSYEIIASGEQNSLQDYAAGNGLTTASGFDYDPQFGGSNGTNYTATYYLPMPATDGRLTAALVWNLKIHGGTANSFNSTATFYNLDLELFDVTNASNWVSVGYSRSTTDNTENLWLPLAAGRKYALQVTRATGQTAFKWDYALAWHTIPEPPVDTDGDGIYDSDDNCIRHANPDQRDTDNDGYGNRCDPDFNNNGTVDSQDGALLKAAFGSAAYPDRDLNGNGVVDSQDGAILKSWFGQPPGPSGLVP